MKAFQYKKILLSICVLQLESQYKIYYITKYDISNISKKDYGNY